MGIYSKISRKKAEHLSKLTKWFDSYGYYNFCYFNNLHKLYKKIKLFNKLNYNYFYLIKYQCQLWIPDTLSALTAFELMFIPIFAQ